MALATTQISSDGDWEAANTSLAKAAAIEPGSVEIFHARSYLSRVLGNPDQAIKLSEQAVALDPLRPISYSTLGYLLYVGGRYDEAKAALQKALDLNPQATYIYLHPDKILIPTKKPHTGPAVIQKRRTDWEHFTA